MSGFDDRAGRGTRWRRTTLVLVAAVLAGLSAWVGFDVWAGRQVDRRIARLEGRYGSLDEATLQVPPVPAGDNRARIVRAAAALVIPSQADVRRALMRSLAQEASSPLPAEGRAFAEANRVAVRLAHDIGTRRQSNWDIDYLQPGYLPPVDRLPWLDMRTLSDAIYVTARLDLEAGQADEAARTIASGLGVSASIRQETVVVAQLFRYALARPQFEAIQRLISQAEPSSTTLEDLARWLDENRTLDPAGNSLLAELKHANAAFAQLEAGEAGGIAAGMMSPRLRLLVRSRLGRPLVRLARARYLRHMDTLLDLRSGPRPQPPWREPRAPSRWAVVDRFVFMFTNGLGAATQVADEFVSDLGGAELAVALRRFRLDHGVYPDDLSALVPAYLVEIPIDPFTGQPPVYHRHEAGFTLQIGRSRPSMSGPEPSPEWTVAR